MHVLCHAVHGLPEAASLSALWARVLRHLLECVCADSQVRLREGSADLSGVLSERARAGHDDLFVRGQQYNNYIYKYQTLCGGGGHIGGKCC